SGIAAAETLRALHSHGERGLRAAKALGIAGALAALNNFWTDGLRLISPKLEPYSLGNWVTKLNEAIFHKVWMDRTVMFLWDPIFIAAGVITGLRVGASMMLGGTLCWAVFVPYLQHRGIVTGSGYRELVQWTLWGGTSCMVASGLVSFIMEWRSALRAFASLGTMFSRRHRNRTDELDAIETPGSWFAIGQLFSLVGLAYLGKVSFDMPYWESALAVLLSFGLALVACRVTGETDTTPIGAMGKVMQLTFGGLSPGNININLMSANIASGAAASSADLLTDLKSGYLLGANPRKQFLAQFSGIFIGTIVTVLAFRIMVPNASVLGSDEFPAPAAQAWKAVAIALSKGLESLGPVKTWSIVIGGMVGLALPLLARFFPRRQQYIPSAAGLGLAWTFHWYYSLLFFLGAVFGYVFERKAPAKSKEYTFPVASGIIAGGSLMGVILIFWEHGLALIKIGIRFLHSAF
ncbi:MAG: OPT/YSL family transporter, partial [Candidatus Omnitrophica bacterium]|nr:OPT/YSL family transporter [Candidatus Omnitrophota bacterium]